MQPQKVNYSHFLTTGTLVLELVLFRLGAAQGTSKHLYPFLLQARNVRGYVRVHCTAVVNSSTKMTEHIDYL